MEQLVDATLPFGLIPAVVPEFKTITVGGAIMGGATESTAHRFGLFSDICTEFELLLGTGELVKLTPGKELFHAIPGSYGSLGVLTSATIKLIPAKPHVHLCYRKREKPYDFATEADFIDGIVFSKKRTVAIEGRFTDEPCTTKRWYFTQVNEGQEEIIPLKTYLFRYDPGAFWMGAYLLSLPFTSRYLLQGLCKLPGGSHFTQKTLDKMRHLPTPPAPFLDLMPATRLWKLHHKADQWIQQRLIIQDFCLPKSRALELLDLLEGTYPLWLCPIKRAKNTQLFAPHDLGEDVLNIGMYGIPQEAAPMEVIMKKLEQQIAKLGGRKVLYSRSFYTPEEFWKIYDQKSYSRLREETRSKGVFADITEKVLSE